ncbi:General transcription factor IIH subunit 4 [Dictyocoela muelleri]|nr:General transcription factor IIH subunit 4 [Dictyocoela muelleri]
MYYEIYKFISSLPTKIYSNPIFSISLLRLFPKNVLKFVFDLICTARHIKMLPSTKEMAEILKFLKELKLIEKRENNLFLNDSFRNALLIGFRNEKIEFFFKRVFDKDGKNDDFTNENNNYFSNNEFKNSNFPEIDKHQMICDFETKMEKFVRIIINGNSSDDLWEIIKFAGLVSDTNEINNKGFEFLLLSKNQKLWFFILKTIEFISSRYENEKRASVKEHLVTEKISLAADERLQVVDKRIWVIEKLILCIFEMGIMEIGVPYEMNRSVDKLFIRYLQKIGLVTIKNNYLFLNNMFFNQEQTSETVMIIETNYKFYAYLNNDYAKNILQLFGNIQLTLPNLIVGQITEDSIQSAFEKGITGSQIINYLSTGKQLPPTVADQILLWESKMHRVKKTEAYLYKGFESIKDFEKTLSFCKQIGCLVEYDRDKKIIVAKVSCHGQVKNFIKNNF